MAINTTIDSIAIGGFDGMHTAHQYLFEHLNEKSGGVISIETGYADLTPGIHRQAHTHFPLFYYQLDAIKALSGADFIKKLHEDFPKLKKIVVGYDFHFGNKRACSCEDLKRMFKGEVIIVDEVKVMGEPVHSRHIRQLLDKGELEKANLYLGYNYQLVGNVIKGQGIGKEKLVATMNIQTEGFRLPKEGVYATLSRLDDGKLYPSVSFIGHRSITDNSFAIETHILESEVPTSKKVTLSFLHYIRENRGFESFEALKTQIDLDIIEAKKVIHLLEL